MTTASSDKPWKVMGHRAARREARQLLRATEDGDVTPHPKKHGNPWSAPKDGKVWYGWSRPDLLRK